MTDPNPELSLADVTWLTRLARTLTRDGALADDLVQETWLTARRSRPATGVNRPWLARVLHNLHLRSLRTESRRAKRERRASRQEAIAGTAELLERAELQQAMAGCLLALEEPYRTTLMQVAFDERSPKEIAENESVSVESVRRRLRKARELLKKKLERKYGRDWKQWYAALLPYARLPLPGEVAVASATASTSSGLPSIPVVLGGFLVSKAFLTTIAAVPLVGMAYFFGPWNSSQPSLDVELEPRESTASLMVADAKRSDEPTSNPGERELVAASKSAANAPETGKPATFVLRGTLAVKDEHGVNHERTDGKFGIRIEASKGSKDYMVSVVDGSWEIELPKDDSMRARLYSGLEVDERGCRWTGKFIFDLSKGAEKPLALTASWLERNSFDVLDAQTRQHLTRVQILARGAFEDRFCIPVDIDAKDYVHRNATSPVQVTPRDPWESVYFVGCKGYAWTRVTVDNRSPEDVILRAATGNANGTKKGSRKEVLLRPSADLTVRFGRGGSGLHSGPVTFHIKVAGRDRVEWACVTNTAKEVRLPGLPVGRYVLRARAHKRAETVRREIELVTGTRVVDLNVPKFDLESARVAGSIAVPEDWEAKGKVLVISDENDELVADTTICQYSIPDKRIPFAKMTRVEVTYRFDAGELLHGKYSFRVDGVDSWKQEVQVGPRSTSELRFDLPSTPMGEALVRVLDERSGKVLTDSFQVFGVYFRAKAKITASYDAAKGYWRVRGLRSKRPIRTKVQTFGHQAKSIDLALVKQPVVREVRLKARTRFGFKLWHDEVLLQPGEVWFKKMKVVRVETGKPAKGGVGIGMGGYFFYPKEPGTFRVRFAQLPGFEAIPEQTVIVRDGEIPVIRVQVRKKSSR